MKRAAGFCGRRRRLPGGDDSVVGIGGGGFMFLPGIMPEAACQIPAFLKPPMRAGGQVV